MNTYKELFPIMYRVIKQYASNRHPIEDLINEVWLLGSVQKVPMKFAGKRIRWDVMQILRELDGTRNPNTRDKKFRVINPLVFEGKFERPLKDKSLIAVDNKDWFDWVVLDLNRREKLVIILYYVEGMTLCEIGVVLGWTESLISVIHKKVIEKLRKRCSCEVHENWEQSRSRAKCV